MRNPHATTKDLGKQHRPSTAINKLIKKKKKGYTCPSASQVALVEKDLPANAGDLKETLVQSLGQEDPLEEGMATHSIIPAWRIPQRGLVGYGP